MTRPVVIAHRGASGYLPEHTSEAKAAAHSMGADYIEQDIVATRDGVLLVLHDIWLESVTDVAARFPDRARADGHFYVVDFDYAEIATLRVHERTVDAAANDAAQDRGRVQLYPGRFPLGLGRFRISTLDEELELIAGLNRATGREAGIYPEIKDPAWHLENGIDLTHLVLTALDDHGYLDEREPQLPPRAYLQCFDRAELQRIRSDVDPYVPLVQLLTGDDPMSLEDLAEIATYAQAIGPPFSSLIEQSDGGAASNGRCEAAHRLGLAVHPYTFRRDQLPSFATDFESLLRFFAADVGVDGLFTDFPDVAIGVLSTLNLN